MIQNIIIERKEVLAGSIFGNIYPAHATRDGESIFWGLTVDEAQRLKELIPEGRITGEHQLFISRQFKFPDQLPSGMIIEKGNKIELWIEYASKRVSIMIRLKDEG